MTGDLVTWKSQASGSATTKRGRVIEVVPPQHAPSEISHTGRRAHESYVVEVVTPKKRGGIKRAVYWPNRVHLRADAAASRRHDRDSGRGPSA